jgi:hypothetical protein
MCRTWPPGAFSALRGTIRLPERRWRGNIAGKASYGEGEKDPNLQFSGDAPNIPLERAVALLKDAKGMVICDHSSYMTTVSHHSVPIRRFWIIDIYCYINMLNQVGLYVATLARSLDIDK